MVRTTEWFFAVQSSPGMLRKQQIIFLAAPDPAGGAYDAPQHPESAEEGDIPSPYLTPSIILSALASSPASLFLNLGPMYMRLLKSQIISSSYVYTIFVEYGTVEI